jgi:biuret amidohydrolase
VVTFDIDLARTALLIVDLQRCFVDDSPVAAPDGPAVVRRLNELAAVCRQRGLRVIHTRHVVRPDHSNAGLLAEVIPAVAHGVIDGSPMPELHPDLVVALEATAREAAVGEFRVLFLRDATATFPMPDAGLRPVSAEEIQRVTCSTIGFGFGFGEVLDVHDAVERLESPGRVGHSATASWPVPPSLGTAAGT